jgi:hypothetical protein
LAVWGGAAALMLLPILALKTTGALPSDPDQAGDFMFLAILLAGLGGTYEIAARTSRRNAYKAGCAVAVLAAMLNIWINLAVGIIGSEENPANLVYMAVIAVAVAGALLARFSPRGMALAMLAAAAAQVMAFLAALAAGLGFTGPITIFFGGLWLISAGLFRKAAGPSAEA